MTDSVFKEFIPPSEPGVVWKGRSAPDSLGYVITVQNGISLDGVAVGMEVATLVLDLFKREKRFIL